ncbi:hypothetical protein FOFC_03477 [Fusarium oxysporum]|nr:hypothetical protein FOFC_03477 [Fusarium oxysporum]
MPPTLSKPNADDLWATAVNRLDKNLRTKIDFDHEKIETVSVVLQLTENAQTECDAKAWRLRRKNGVTVSVRDVLAKVIKWVNHFKEIGDIAVQYDPGYAALPWAGIRFLLQIVIGDFQAYKFVLESIENIIELLCRHAFVEELLLQFSKAPTKGPSASNPAHELRQALVQLYTSVLPYLAHARAYYQQSTAKRLVKSALLQPSDLEESFTVIADAQSKVDRCLHVASVQDELDRHDGLKDMVAALQAPVSRWSDELNKITDQLDKTKRREILQWLSKEPYRKHHQLIREGILEGTGQWLLSDPVYIQWKEESASSILWLHGIPGSGKSKLVSLVVEDAVVAFEKHQQAPPAYFYCSRSPAEPARADPEAILASIARQLSCLKPGHALLQPTIAVYDTHEEEGFAAESLRLHETCKLIVRLSENYPMLTIILDALDECNPATRESLLSAMEDILRESPCLVKIFVSSRDDQDIVYRLQRYPNLKISSHKNSSDIANFVESETGRLLNSGKLLRYSSAQQMMKQKIIKRVASDAQGMLLCAQRRLSSAEFLSAVSMAVPQQQLLRNDQILDFCCNLVVLDTQLDTFRFAHLSVREFLEKQEGYPEVTVSSAISKWNTYLEHIPWDIEYDLRNKLRACCATVGSWAFIACAFDIYECLEKGTGCAIDGLQNENNETCEQVAAVTGSCKVLSKLLSIGKVRISEDVVKAAASNHGNGKEVMGLLLDRRRDQVAITEPVVKAAVIHDDNEEESRPGRNK